MSRWNRTKRSRIESLESRIPPPASLLDEWLKTISDDDVDTLATAAKASKDKGMTTLDPSLLDPDTLDRLESDYQRFKAEHEQQWFI